ncbi:MAG: SDR family NAD(P)-dependent oxidoreductase [Aeromicrobium sp.]
MPSFHCDQPDIVRDPGYDQGTIRSQPAPQHHGDGPTSEAVLVTGASTGIGRAIVERLVTDATRVFAAVRDLSAVDQVEHTVDALPPRGVELYGDAIESMKKIVAGSNDAGIPPSLVADAAHHALFSRHPKAEYLVGREAKAMSAASTLIPYRAFDAMVLRVMRSS